MTEDREQEIAANLSRAESSLAAARVLLAAGHADDAVSRAYYAAFYAATAALLREGLDFGKHSGVIAAVHRVFVKPGRLDRRFGRALNWLFELRSVGDYGETEHVPPEEAASAIETAEQVARELKGLRHPEGN